MPNFVAISGDSREREINAVNSVLPKFASLVHANYSNQKIVSRNRVITKTQLGFILDQHFRYPTREYSVQVFFGVP